MRVWMLTHNMATVGGSYQRSHALATQLAALGNEITLIASRRDPGLKVIEKTEGGVRSIQMGDVFPRRIRHGGLSPVDMVGRTISLLGNRPDIVHGFDHRPCVSVPSILARRFGRARFVSDWADLWGEGGIAGQRSGVARATLGQADHYAERLVRRYADAVTAVTTELAERAKALGVTRHLVRVVSVGANADVIRPLPQAAMRAKYGIPGDAKVLVHAGFAPYDADLLADVFVALARDDPRMLLLMTGARLRTVEEVGRAAGLADRVRYLGFRPYESLGEVLSCADVGILPYTNRPLNSARYPNRVGDYLAAGLPVATNLTGDLGRMVRDEKVGVAAEDRPEAFAGAIRNLLEHDGYRGEVGRRARTLAETRLSWRAMAERVHELYVDLLNGDGRSKRVRYA